MITRNSNGQRTRLKLTLTMGDTHYVWFQWMCVKISGPEDDIDDAFRNFDGFSATKDELVDHFDNHENLEVIRLT